MPRTCASTRRVRVLAGVAALVVATSSTVYAASLPETGGVRRHHGDRTSSHLRPADDSVEVVAHGSRRTAVRVRLAADGAIRRQLR